MNCSEGSVRINGTVAYADQNPWILNDTVRNNILFGEPFDEIQYKSALHHSRL
jgi:ABC-type multidrug transport system fused ATPase/permease subunit